jgi:hypothetical protein
MVEGRLRENLEGQGQWIFLRCQLSCEEKELEALKELF